MSVLGYTGYALNQSPDSKNEIHGDQVAKDYGFQGGLVPGVTLSAYLAQPAIEAWGEDWLETGRAHIAVRAPIYDKENFRIDITHQDESKYTAELINSSAKVCATAEVALDKGPCIAPVMRHDPIAEADYQPSEASSQWFEQLRIQGCYAFRYHWQQDHKMANYFEDIQQMPELLRAPDRLSLKSGMTRQGFANMSFILGCANWIFGGNAAMNPWVHLETKSKNYQAIVPETRMVAEMQVLDDFSKKGHQFCDVNVVLFDEQTGHCLAETFQRAIYRLRGF